MKRATLSSLWIMGLALAVFSSNADAGFMDKLNAAAQKLNEKTEEMNQKVQNSSSKKAGCENGRGGATCLDALREGNKCFDPLKGYRAKLSADLIENKLATQNDLTMQARQNLEEDLSALREAQMNGSDSPTIAGRENSSRYLMDITPEEQTQINRQYTEFYAEITQKCQGRDFDGTGGTKTHYVKDNSKEMAARAKQDEAMSGMQECMEQMQGIRWRVTADVLEAKMDQQNLSAKEKEEWLEDIAMVREASEKNLMMPQADNPSVAMRYAQRLTAQEQMEISTTSSQKSQKIMADCSATAKKGLKTPAKDWSKHDGGLVDHSKSPANKTAKPSAKASSKDRGVIYVKYNGALSCYLGACGGLDNIKKMSDCSEQTGGYWWKVLAEGIEEKLKNDKNLSETDRIEMQEDVEALRRADGERLAAYPPPDPSRSMRYQDWFTDKEFRQLQVKHKEMYDAQMNYCYDKFGDAAAHNMDYGDRDIKKTDAWKKNQKK